MTPLPVQRCYRLCVDRSSQVAVGNRAQYLHVVVGEEMIQQLRGDPAVCLRGGELLEEADHPSGAQRFSLLPGTVEAAVKVCGVSRGT